MKLSIIVCVFNEISTIKKIYNQILEVELIKNIEKEIIIIDNNSTDGTKEILENIRENNTKIVFQNKNLGKGNSLIEGIKIATVIMQFSRTLILNIALTIIISCYKKCLKIISTQYLVLELKTTLIIMFII